MNKDISFGRIVKEHRKAHDLTQAELARRVACATITIRKIEADALRPSQQIAERLATALNIPLDERAAFVRLARTSALAEPSPPPIPTPPILPEEIGDEDLSGRAIRGYELGERIGSGGFGAVYRAVQPLIDREVAIKIILPQYADHPDFIRRFESEAQLVARLEHPYVVPLYDYWREPKVAYLVMRLLRGGNLQDQLNNGALSLEGINKMLDQVGSALHTAHRAGVVHRDIKPANVLLDEDGNNYLADFGIAKNLNLDDMTQAGEVIGSPAYISPEQIKAEPIRPQADIYCLGIMLYELLTGQKPFKGPTPIAYIQQHLDSPLPALQEQNNNLPPALDIVIRRATAKNPNDRYPDVLSLVEDFRRAVTLPLESGQWLLVGNREKADVENPYKGLRAFNEADAPDFFGRETLIQTLLGRMSDSDDLARFLAVVGPSGSGKSSAVRAGLIPALRQGGLPDSENWFIVDFLPGTHPMEELEATLLRVAINPPESLLTQLKEDERGLLRAVHRILPANKATELVLVIDQFEEIFTLCTDEAVRTHLMNSLVTAILDPRSRLRVVITLRADFTDRPLNYIDFGELVRQRTEFVIPLTPDELEDAMVKPAEYAGLTMEPGLPETIITDLGDQPGTLPLLQYTLTELFERRVGSVLTLGAYQSSGGVRGALAGRADELYNQLDKTAQRTARRLFLRLITLGDVTGDGLSAPDTRRRVLRSELSSLVTRHSSLVTNDPRQMTNDQGQLTMNTVIDLFGRHRLLTFDRDPVTREPTVEVAHEALIREWQRLRGWLDEDREFLLWQQRLRAALHQWEASEQDEGALLRGGPLGEAENWFTQRRADLSESERNFIRASLDWREHRAAERETQRQRELEAAQKLAETKGQAARRLRWLVVGLAIFLVVSVGLSMFAFNRQAEAEANQAQAEANLALSESQRLAAEANTILQGGGDPELAALLSLQALNTSYTPQADSALQQVSKQDYGQHLFAGHTEGIEGLAFSPDGKYALSSSYDDTARIWDVQSGRLLHTLTGHIAPLRNVSFSPNGQLALTGSHDGTAKLWNVKTGELLHTLTGHDAMVPGVSFSPNSRYALTGSFDATARLWDVETGQEVRVFDDTWGETEGIWDVAFSPDGQYFLLANDIFSEVGLWENATGQKIRRLIGASGGVLSVTFSPDGRYVIACDGDGFVWRWDLKEPDSEPMVFSGHTEIVSEIAISPDGNYVLSAGDDNTARLWDIETGQEVRRFASASKVKSVAFSPDGKQALLGYSNGAIRLWDVLPSPDLRTFRGHKHLVAAAKISPDGRYLLTGSHDNSARLWDAHTGQALHLLDGHTDWPQGVAFSPDGRYAATGSWDRTARLWDVETGQELRVFAHPDAVLGVAFSPDGRRLVTGGWDSIVRLWDVETGQELHSFTGHTAAAPAVAFSPDGRYVLSGSSDENMAWLWDAETGQEVRQYPGYSGWINGISFSPDSKYILTAARENTAQLWEVESGQALDRFPGDNGVFSQDGKYILTGGDKTAHLWDRATGQQLRTFGVTYNLWGVGFSPDGQFILIHGSDKLARLWDTDYQTLVDSVCARVLRDLTDKERHQYGIKDQLPTCPSGS